MFLLMLDTSRSPALRLSTFRRSSWLPAQLVLGRCHVAGWGYVRRRIVHKGCNTDCACMHAPSCGVGSARDLVHVHVWPMKLPLWILLFSHSDVAAALAAPCHAGQQLPSGFRCLPARRFIS